MRPAPTTVTEVVKCPACAEQTKQERLGQVSLDNPAGRPSPALYRCGACDFLYTVPKLSERPPSLRDTTPI